jgi:hypothetical protein
MIIPQNMVQVKGMYAEDKAVDHFSEIGIVVDEQVVIKGREKQGIQVFPDLGRWPLFVVHQQLEFFFKTGEQIVFARPIGYLGMKKKAGTVVIDQFLLADRQERLPEAQQIQGFYDRCFPAAVGAMDQILHGAEADGEFV